MVVFPDDPVMPITIGNGDCDDGLRAMGDSSMGDLASASDAPPASSAGARRRSVGTGEPAEGGDGVRDHDARDARYVPVG